MNFKTLILTLFVTVLVAGGSVIFKNKIASKSEVKGFSHEFQLKVGECALLKETDMILIDIETPKTYVFASAKRYYAGPYPIKDEDVVKLKETQMDSHFSKLDCKQLESKYYEPPTEESVKKSEEQNLNECYYLSGLKKMTKKELGIYKTKCHILSKKTVRK
jgi:hypothetical protein